MNDKEEMSALRLGIIRMLSVTLFLCVAAALLILLSMFIPVIAFYGILLLLGVGAMVWAIDALIGRITSRITRIVSDVIKGFVYAQAADDRGEILRNAVRLAAVNGQLENRAMSLNNRIKDEATKLATQASTAPRSGDGDDWDWLDNDFKFAETE